MNLKTPSLATLFLTVAAMGSNAQTVEVDPVLKDAAQKAISNNPEVVSKFNAFESSRAEVDVAKGAYLPRLDLSAEVGKTKDRYSNRTPQNGNLSYNGVALTLSQVLWDGLSTKHQVARLNHTSVSRYFDFLDATEQTALEATRAYYDVQRFRRLVKLAEENYVHHKHAFNQIQSRVKAGVARGVDLEQAAARLALAESNLITENANLHDVSSRYLRIVGELPPEMDTKVYPLIGENWSDAQTVGNLASARSYAVTAAIENLRALRAQADTNSAAYQPRIQASIRGGVGKNLDGSPYQKRNITGEITLNWNLFNGFSDRARGRAYASQQNQGEDLRDKACRDSRQLAAIAFNDVQRLADQVKALQRNTLAIQKARDAYRQQFDIGQRSLLDLLNSENELYTAKRSLSNAQMDLATAYARTHAASSTLTQVLGLKKKEVDDAPDVNAWNAGEDQAARCAAVNATPMVSSFEQLDQLADQAGKQ